MSHQSLPRRSKITTGQIISDFLKVHGGRYNYDSVIYKTMHTSVSIDCPIHGTFQQTPNAHIRQKQGCPKCGRIGHPSYTPDTTESFIAKARQIHGDKYDYSLTIYGKNAHEKVVVICSVHGEFKISPNSHLSKTAGCSKCGLLKCGWTRTAWREACKERKAKLYIVKLYTWDEKESFYKIGITVHDLEKRFNSTLMPYNWQEIKVIESDNSDYIFDLERKLHKENKEFQYLPKVFFDGFTECFSQIKNADIH